MYYDECNYRLKPNMNTHPYQQRKQRILTY